MTAPAPYDVVVSLAGHDRGRLYQVVGEENGRLWLADGRLKKLEAPKQKGPRHVRVIAHMSEAPTTDKQIKTTLAQAAETARKKGDQRG